MSRTLPWTDSVLLSVSQSRQATARAPSYSGGRVGRVELGELHQHAHRDARAQADAPSPSSSGPSNQTPPRSPFAPAMRMAAISRRSAPSVPRGAGDEEAEFAGKAAYSTPGDVRRTRAGPAHPNPLPRSARWRGVREGIRISGRRRGRRRRGGPGPSRGGRRGPGGRRRARRSSAASSLSAAARSFSAAARSTSVGGQRLVDQHQHAVAAAVSSPAAAARPAGSPARRR